MYQVRRDLDPFFQSPTDYMGVGGEENREFPRGKEVWQVSGERGEQPEEDWRMSHLRKPLRSPLHNHPS